MEDVNIYGLLLGVVTDNQDPDTLGRVKVKLEMLGDTVETDWIPVLSLYASPECGAFFIPEVEDQVVVGFIGDNPDFGVVMGGIWTDTQKPPETKENTGSDLNQDGENNLRFIKSRAGSMLIFDDKDGEEKIQIIASGAKTRVEYLAADELLSLETDKDMIISSKGKLGIDAEEGVFNFKKGLKLDADGLSLNTSSKDIEAIASQNMVIEGTTIKLN